VRAVDELGILFCFAFFVVLFLLPIWIVIGTRKTHALQRVGERYNGTVSSTSALSHARLRFFYSTAPVTVRFRRKGGKFGGEQTEVRMATQLVGFKLEAVYLMGRSRFWWGGNGIEWTSGQEQFDQMFSVTTTNESAANELLTNGVRWQMQQLGRMSTAGLYFSIHQGEMLVATPRMLIKRQPLDDFLRLSLELYDQLMLAKAVGIDFVENQTAVIDEVKCPVCSVDIKEQMVICVRCKTPHCHDCWLYNGSCATFACGETRFVHPVAPDPTPAGNSVND